MAATDPNDPKTYGLNLPTAMVIAAFCGIAWVNTIELQFRIWLRFKRYKGLYFWSLVFSSLGCAFHALGFLFLDFLIIKQPNAVGLIIGVSWWCMVTGQALVLYSRLHLVVRDKRKVRWVLIMIMTNFCVLHLPIMVVSQAVGTCEVLCVCLVMLTRYSQGYSFPYPNRWLDVYNVYEKVQMVCFTVQETIISGLYLYEARKILRPSEAFRRDKTNDVVKHLIWVNLFIIFLDAALLTTEFNNLFDIQTVFKAAIYSVKLRFEFVVLNQLVDIVGGGTSAMPRSDTYASGAQKGGTIQSSRNVQLDTFGSGGRPRQRPGEFYSASAGPGSVTSPQLAPKSGGVLRTSEIQVNMEDESSSPRGHGPVEPFDLPMQGRRAPSPSESEIELAPRPGHAF